MIKQPKNTDMSVDPRTGAFRYHTVDLVIPARGFDFRFERWHDSFGYFGFGKGWEFDWDERLEFDESDGSIRYWFPNSQMQRFVRNPDGTYSPAVSWIYNTLQVLGDTRIQITLKNGQRRLFDAESGRLVKRIDLFGNEMTFEWEDVEEEPWPRLKAISDTTGRVVTATWDVYDEGAYATMTLTDWTGRKLKYDFKDDGGQWVLHAYTDPEGYTTRYVLDSITPGFVGIRAIDLPSGRWLTNYEVGPAPQINMVGRQEFGNGRVIEYTYDTVTRTSTRTEEGKTWTFEWNTDGNLIRKTDPLGNTWEYEYNSNNLVTKITNPDLSTVEMTYDSKGNMLTRKNEKGKTWTYEYHPTFNKITKITGPAPLSYVTEMTYDSTTGAMLTFKDPRGKTWTYEYWAGTSLLKKTTDPNTNTVQMAYNLFGYLTSSTNGLGKVTTFETDAVGNQVAVIDPLGHRTTRAYDANNRLVRLTTPLGNSTRIRYDGNGNVETITDPMNRGTRFRYSSMDDLLQVVDAAGGVVAYEYDLRHNMVKQTDPNGNSYEFYYDILDRQIRVADPMGQVTTTTHDPYCGTYTVLNPEDEATSYVRDVTCLLTRRVFQDGSSFDFTYDVESRRTEMTQPQARKFGEFKLNELKYGYDPADTTTFSWDGANHMTQVTYPGSNSILMTWDDGGRLTRLTDIHGTATDYVWDAANRLVSMTRAGKTATYVRDDAGRVTRLSLPNGVTCDYTYDEDSRILRMLWANGSGTLHDIRYVYDASGNRTRRSVTDPSGTTTVEDYAYDALYRLVNVKENGNLRSRYRFDPAGNRVQRASANGDEFSTFDASDELVSTKDIQFGSDRVGRLTRRDNPAEDAPVLFAWDYANQLRAVSLPDGTATTYRYNADDLRFFRKQSNGTERRYYWIPTSPLGMSQLLNEADWSGNSMASYIMCLHGPIGLEDVAGNTHYFITDAIGSVIAMTDSSGVVTDIYRYDEFGRSILKTGANYNPMRFTGQELDDGHIPLYYLRNRYYDPATGRFLSRDPLAMNLWRGGNRYRDNLYAYASGRPTTMTDPTGLGYCSQTYPNYQQCLTCCSERADMIRNIEAAAATFCGGVCIWAAEAPPVLAACVAACILGFIAAALANNQTLEDCGADCNKECDRNPQIPGPG